MNHTAGEPARQAARREPPSASGRGSVAAEPFPHVAAVIGSDAELLDAALPFLEEGLHAGDLLVLSCPPQTAEVVRRGLGWRAAELQHDPRLSLWGSRAPDALETIRALIGRARANGGSGRLRVLGEISFGGDPLTRHEGERWEAAVNRLLAGQPMAAMCVFDSRRLPPEVLDSAAATHTEVVVEGRRRKNPQFRDPVDYLRLLPTPRQPVEDATPVFAVDDAPTLAELRHRLGAVLEVQVPDRDQREDLHLGVSEVAANAFRHGVRPVSARAWADGRQIVVAITDRGRTFTDQLAGFQPAHGDDLARGGMGLWLARKLWDHVDLLPAAAGLTVRLSARLR